MDQLLPLYIWIPLAGFLVSLFIPRKNESALSGTVIFTAFVHMLSILGFTGYWLMNGHVPLDEKYFILFKSEHNEIAVNFYFDSISAVFVCTGSLITFLVAVYSRYFIHREGGFKRFFCTVLLFFMGYNLIVLSGNFETLFLGWEIIGVCTFLLVSFYRERYLPVKNSMKVISVYRLSDICLILAMWMSHHVWHENITFVKLNDLQTVANELQHHYAEILFITTLIVVAAAVKSAQLPFSSWLPRAMEGPTTSSAIFYGALSVHVGVFLLMRTYGYWETITEIRLLIGGIGLATAIVAIHIAKVQSSLKPQIAYSSIAQIGLIFIEIALGLHTLALVHFAGNAFLRSYQLLVSPSMQHYLIHQMFFNFKPKTQARGISSYSRIANSFYMLSLKEWNTDPLLYRFFWAPFKWTGRNLNFVTTAYTVATLAVIYAAGLGAYYFREAIPTDIFAFLPYVFSLVGLMLILRSFAQRGDAAWSWFLVVGGQLFITLAVAQQNEDFTGAEILMYLGGAIISAVVGYGCLRKVRTIDNDIKLDRFHGYIYEQPRIGLVFMLSCLGLLGLPCTPTFIGIDIMISHIHKEGVFLIAFTALGFLFMELSILRIYARVFMGQHKKAYHAIAFKSS